MLPAKMSLTENFEEEKACSQKTVHKSNLIRASLRQQQRRPNAKNGAGEQNIKKEDKIGVKIINFLSQLFIFEYSKKAP